MNNIITKEIFFDIEDQKLIKKILWSFFTIITLFINFNIFSVILLSIAGIYYKKGGTQEVIEYLMYTFMPIIAILLFIGMNVLVYAIG
jgi:uncharacterized membrane protein